MIPVYNEVESVPHLHRTLGEALSALECAWEVVYVDDGSSDGSVAVLEQLARDDSEHVVVVQFRRNHGQTAAMMAGMDHASGDVIALMDADLQNDPADIPMMLARLDEGYDAVCGWRANRQDKLLSRKLPSVIANRLIRKVTGVNLHDYGCTLKVIKREIVKSFRLYGEMHRFIPAYIAMSGGKILETPVTHHARRFGTSKYGLGRTFKVILDLCTVNMFVRYSTKPIYLFGKVGAWAMAAGLLPIAYLLAANLGFGAHEPVVPLLTSSAVLFAIGAQSVMLGLVAEVLMRTYHESQSMPIYHLKKVIGRKDSGDALGVSQGLEDLGSASDR